MLLIPLAQEYIYKKGKYLLLIYIFKGDLFTLMKF